MKLYKASECWNVGELEATLNQQAAEGYELKFYSGCCCNNYYPDEKHFIIMEREVPE